MPTDIVVHILVGLAPVLCFLVALLYLDSYKLVSMRTVVAMVASGVFVAAFSYGINVVLLRATALDIETFKRYVGPVVEELGKGLVIVALIRSHRIGFLIDAAIFGFAVGTGFATIENLYYLDRFPDVGIGMWIVRGFGTALMHGGCTAIFAMISVAILERARKGTLVALVPGFVVAVLLHS